METSAHLQTPTQAPSATVCPTRPRPRVARKLPARNAHAERPRRTLNNGTLVTCTCLTFVAYPVVSSAAYYSLRVFCCLRSCDDIAASLQIFTILENDIIRGSARVEYSLANSCATAGTAKRRKHQDISKQDNMYGLYSGLKKRRQC